MRKSLLVAATAMLCGINACCASEVNMTSQGWEPSSFGQAGQEIAEFADLNLLEFPGAKLVKADGVESPARLTDGSAGVYGGDGRVAVNGAPSRVVYYLGQPRKIASIRLFSGNIDARGNQDFEIRLANNASAPGEEPQFPAEPTFTSGDKVVGRNNGAFMTAIEPQSGVINDQEYDWIEFKLWRTYNVKAGEPGKDKSAANSWGSMLELQVLATPTIPRFSVPKKNATRGKRAQRRKLRAELDKLSDVAFALENRDSLKLAIDSMFESYEDEIGASIGSNDLKNSKRGFDKISNRANSSLSPRVRRVPTRSFARASCSRRLRSNPAPQNEQSCASGKLDV